MTVQIDPALASAVSKSLSDEGGKITAAKVEEPTGFDWSTETVAGAISIINQSILALGKATKQVAADTADSAKGFQSVDELAAQQLKSAAPGGGR